MVRDCFKYGDQLRARGDWYQKKYPLQRTLVWYEHDFDQGFSMPVFKLYTYINDIEFGDKSGEIVFREDYCDEDTMIPHQVRETGNFQMDDANLQAKPLTEIFIHTEEGDQIIDEGKVREGCAIVPYVRTGTSAHTIDVKTLQVRDDNARNNQSTETFEEWRRPDGTIFTKKTKGAQKTVKPKLAAPLNVSSLRIDSYNVLQQEYRMNRGLPYYDVVHTYKRK